MATSAKMKKVAEDFGYQIPFLKANNELWSIFNKAVNGSWSADRFVAAVRNTKWYKTHSETWRQSQQLRFSDPKTWTSNLEQTIAAVRRTAGQIGVSLTSAQYKSMAQDAMMMGWSDDQVRAALAGWIGRAGTGYGEVGEVEQTLKNTAWRNGVSVTESYITDWAKRVVTGQATVDDAAQSIREKFAKSLAPGFAKELEAGQDLYDVASPWMQTMAKTLELNPADIDLFDPTIRQALASSADNDGEAGSTPLWKFERDLKKDSRWLKTSNARDALDNAARSLTQTFGLGV